MSTQFQLSYTAAKESFSSLCSSSADGESGNRGLEALAGPYDQAAIDTSGAELGDALPGSRVREDLGDGILVGAVKSSVRGTSLGTLVKTFELVHGTVCVREREYVQSVIEKQSRTLDKIQH